MESSTVIAFRALVMLACLIVVPMAAIFGSQFPDVVKSVLIDRVWPQAAAAAHAPDANARAEAPPFGAMPTAGWRAETAPAAGANANPGSGLIATSAGAPRGAAAPGAAIETAAAWGAGDGHVRYAGGDSSATAGGGIQRADGSAPAYPGASGNGPSAPGFSGIGGPAGAAAAAPTGSTQVIAQPDRFTWMERRLREYGATYYLLETWASDAERYRFICRMAVPNHPGHTRNFEATDTDPLRAMGRVVEQVEGWRAGRLQ